MTDNSQSHSEPFTEEQLNAMRLCESQNLPTKSHRTLVRLTRDLTTFVMAFRHLLAELEHLEATLSLTEFLEEQVGWEAGTWKPGIDPDPITD